MQALELGGCGSAVGNRLLCFPPTSTNRGMSGTQPSEGKCKKNPRRKPGQDTQSTYRSARFNALIFLIIICQHHLNQIFIRTLNLPNCQVIKKTSPQRLFLILTEIICANANTYISNNLTLKEIFELYSSGRSKFM